MLILVRHAMPAVDPDADPSAWPLGSAGRTAARQLAGRLPRGALLVASDEPKAWQTLDPDGRRDVRRDPRLGEVRRNEAFSDDFMNARRSYLSGSQIPGWEQHAAVARRFGEAVTEAIAQAAETSAAPGQGSAVRGQASAAAGGRDVVIASHGMAMTIWLSRAIGLTDSAEFWLRLRYPDLLAVDLAGGAVRLLGNRPTAVVR
jgi:broad specificity phosphatase PhoE